LKGKAQTVWRDLHLLWGGTSSPSCTIYLLEHVFHPFCGFGIKRAQRFLPPLSMLRRIASLTGRIFELWVAHQAPRLGAALAYYTLLSLAPLSVILVKMVAVPFGDKLAQHDTFGQLRPVLGAQGNAVLEGMIAGAAHTTPNLWASLGAIFLLLFGASSVFAELRSALNLIWDVSEVPIGFVRALVVERLVAFAMIIALGCVMILSTAGSLVIASSARFISEKLALPPWVLPAANRILSFVVTGEVFALLFRFVPAVRIAWKDANVVAVVTAGLFVFARVPLELYLSRAGIGSAYGTAASLVAFVFWVYVGAQVFYLGCEFTRVYSEEFGSLVSRRKTAASGATVK
jgi:membrane protein